MVAAVRPSAACGGEPAAAMNARTDLRRALRAHALFAGLDDRAFNRVARSAGFVRVAAGGFACHRGERADGCFVVMSATLNLVLHSRDGDEKVVETLGVGQSFGDSLIFDDEPTFPLSAVAGRRAALAVIPGDACREALEGNAAGCVRLLVDANRRLHALASELEAHSLVSARTRIVRHLLELASRGAGRQEEVREVRLPETKQRIAARLGVAPETLSRTFRALREAGLLAVRGRVVRIIDLEALRSTG